MIVMMMIIIIIITKVVKDDCNNNNNNNNKTGVKLDKEHLYERVPGSVETNHEWRYGNHIM
jgi:hypothetical protein